MTNIISQLLNSSLDTAIPSASMDVANGDYALGAAPIDNRATSGTIPAYDLGDLTITLSAATGSANSAPYITVWILPAVDGTNYPDPPGNSAGPAPTALAYAFQQTPSAAHTTIICPDLPLPPYQFYVQIQNNLGVDFPTGGGNTCQLQRKTLASW